MAMIGYTEVPADFKYMRVYLKGKPKHPESDLFFLRHPVMERGRRAKIFSPFDALKGFSDAVAAKDVLYTGKPDLSDGEKEEISRRLSILHDLTLNRRKARENSVNVRVDCFVPCTDRDHAAYGHSGRRMTVSGVCSSVDGSLTRSIAVGENVIRFEDILAIDAGGIFDRAGHPDAP